jgi:rhamnose utilization protein RhaD (predicted bifunctional aldolase and dehydrogenase)
MSEHESMKTQTSLRSVQERLLKLSRELGRPEHKLAILGEGNTSAAIDDKTFFIKASGTELRKLTRNQLVRVRFETILPMLNREFDQEQTRDTLLASRMNPKDFKPSVETIFHAWLLRQEGVKYIAHTHPTEVNKILCSGRAKEFAERRLFPDEVVYCGPKSLLMEYADPGARLGAAIRDRWNRFVVENGYTPRLILIASHGLIAVGSSPEAVLAATLIAVKAAEVFVGAYALGDPAFMDPNEVLRIHSRLDEHYRQKQLKF